VLDSPRAIAASWPNPRLRAIAELALVVTEAPWTLSRAHLTQIYKAGLSDEDILHVITLASFFGHLNRIADAVQGPLDYQVKLQPPATDPTRAAWSAAPALVVGRPAIDIARRPATATAFTEWRHYIFYSHDAPLTRRQRTLIARWVASWLGDGGISPPTDLTINPLDDALRAVAEVVTLAPWKITDATFTPLRAAGFDDAGVFDVCATATSAGVFSRIEVALAALGT
jgi:alkylhydroperoxidase family enzyme